MRDWRKANPVALLDDGVTGAMQINVDIVALVNPDLPSRHDYNTVLDRGNMGRPADTSGDDQALFDVL
jgi:hypothetical protein